MQPQFPVLEIGPGIYLDRTGTPLFVISELLAAAGLPDSEENRSCALAAIICESPVSPTLTAFSYRYPGDPTWHHYTIPPTPSHLCPGHQN